ncbi:MULTISPECIES: hypothetical protein [unclassified Cryobacterium]|uniref:hypothetical protein n=1 Tax=unclassified Cryobacterium TaxID=2649013 RepID=UPI002AB53679|nr:MULTISPECIES: hypothetical protein [unclassified Cryobacterium]MDY7527871.1 hypothetical protein [Cryobacterium sp. 10C2]MDY7556362.1 hypothetical protein [Cryobacterium sp. 10C3]MEB0001407.1 hypothetical protein [Cryobacterium sp. RTC2.1]MEB0202280.1 hypothetical protein [Cryobacterium sp. 5I3]MEB0289622.1 hypothetical protein [Cryobacterium sp. 10C2]
MKMPVLVTLTLLGALALSGCATGPSTSPSGTAAPRAAATAAATESASPEACSGVRVVVDFGTLAAPKITDCVDTGTATTIAASAVMKTAAVATEGTVQYGDQVVCRVNGRPAADETVTVTGQASFVESCQSMAPAYAYWALWIQQSPGAAWEYAQEGLGSLQVTPGQSLGLVFTTGTETPTPGS